MPHRNNRLLLLAISMGILHISGAQNSPQDYVDAHNQARAEVGVGPMTWDSRVASFAQNYANQRRGDCQLVHSQNSAYGENLAYASGLALTGVQAVNLWVGEKADYDYNLNTCAPGKICGHYTQVVWSDSVRLGCARVHCDNSAWFVTCNYDPPGNYVGSGPGLGIVGAFRSSINFGIIRLKGVVAYETIGIGCHVGAT
ncbi:hypothetical protein L1887_04352 [Cichorium endivia]|nr:hypothetical protein L1887_04352 [Cichorium endivia]